ncbi:MAG: polysaccharide biosynthesis protein, partial [Pseudomonadota bacterium]
MWNALPFYQLMLVGGLALAITMGIPQVKLSTFDLHSAAKIGLFALSLSIIATAVNIVIYLGVSRTVPMIFGMVMFSLSVGWKLAALAVLDWMRAREHPQSQVAVYGAGPHGIQLVNALEQSIDYRITTVIDDNPSLHGVVICGHRVQSRAALDKAVKAGRVDRVLLALTDPSPDHRRDVLSHLETLPCEVQTLPAYVDIIENGGMARSLKPVSSDDLLGRDSVDLDIPEISNAYEGKSVLISGAGGSIGSELCRQVLTCSP